MCNELKMKYIQSPLGRWGPENERLGREGKRSVMVARHDGRLRVA